MVDKNVSELNAQDKENQNAQSSSDSLDGSAAKIEDDAKVVKTWDERFQEYLGSIPEFSVSEEDTTDPDLRKATVLSQVARKNKIDTVTTINLEFVVSDPMQLRGLLQYVRSHGLVISSFTSRVKHPEQAIQIASLGDFVMDEFFRSYLKSYTYSKIMDKLEEDERKGDDE